MDVEISTAKQVDSNSELRLRSSTSVNVQEPLTGTIHPFLSSNTSVVGSFMRELKGIIQERQTKKILAVTFLNLLCTVVLLVWCNSTNSMALTAYTYLTIYDIFSLLTCLVSIWVRQQKQSPIFSFGYERFEVLAVFASTILAQLGAMFIIKESTERMIQQPEVHTGRLLMGTTLAFFFHMAVTYGIENQALNHVIAASGSSWLQEHVADMSESLCHVIPGLSKLLLPRINPFSLIAFAGAAALAVTYTVIDVNNYLAADTWAAVWIAVMTCGTLFPMSVYSGKILLQTTPSHMIGQLDKCIREASTLDGVLEFRHEHFWTLSFGTMTGTVHVRIRRDADEQMVLAHVSNRLSNLVSLLTVQIFKDDWTRSSAFQVIGENSLPKLPNAMTLNSPGGKSSPTQWQNHSHADGIGHGHSHAHPANNLSEGLPNPLTPLSHIPTAAAIAPPTMTSWTSNPGFTRLNQSSPNQNSLQINSNSSALFNPSLSQPYGGMRTVISANKPSGVNSYSATQRPGLIGVNNLFSMQGSLGDTASFGMKAMQFNQDKFQ